MTDEFSNSANLPEDVQLGIQLESIFMPETRKQRDAIYANGTRFVHYTSADAAFKIIGSKRLWMRNAICMSDYREVQHGFDMLAKFFSSDNPGLAAFCEALDASAGRGARGHPGAHGRAGRPGRCHR